MEDGGFGQALNVPGINRTVSKVDVVGVFAIVSGPEGVGLFRQVRDRMLGGHLACSTLVIAGLASPDWKIEIAVRAAKG